MTPAQMLKLQVDAWNNDTRYGKQGCLMLAVNADKANLPAHFVGEVGLVFEFPAAVKGLSTDETGLWVSLRFGGTWFRCRIPWGSVTKMYDRDTLTRYRPRIYGEPGPEGAMGIPCRSTASPITVEQMGSNVVPFRRKT